MSKKMTPEELKRVEIERYVQSIFPGEKRHKGVLNAVRYLDKNGCGGVFSESAIEVISYIALSFAAGELDWVKDLGGEEE